MTSVRCVAHRLMLGILLALPAGAAAQQPIDEAYTTAIKEFTTEPFFLTPLVDHLPESDLPTPLDHLGHIAGARDVLTYPEEIYGYMRALDEASDRVTVFSIGQTEEGREMIVVVVSSEDNIARLEEHKAMLAALADPRKTPDEEARRIIPQARPIYWAAGSIHSPETGSPEMLMELVYRLAAGESDHIRAVRENVIFMTNPVTEVDGRAKQVDLHMAPRKDPDINLPSRLLYWGKYVAHDNNRDGMGLSLALMQNVTRTFLEYNPTVFHDLHESATYLYTSTGRGPYNPNIDPILVNEWNRLAYKEVQDMTAFGVPGVYTHDFYDGWAPNYMFWVANMRNSIGRFYETQGSRNASEYLVSSNVDREWHRPSTPLKEVVWSIRNNVNLQQSALLIALREVADHREDYLQRFYLKSQRSVAKARSEGPAAYVFPADDPRPGQQARLVSLMQRHGVEVHRTSAAASSGDTQFPAGSYVIRMDQPFSRTADILLDIQYYNPTDPRPYDDTGWTLGALFDARTERVEDVALLDVPMTLMEEPVSARGGVENAQGATAFLVDYNADNGLGAFRFAHRNIRIDAAESAFEAASRSFKAGSFIIRSSGNPGDLAELLDAAGQEYGFTAFGVSTVPSVSTHPVGAPRIAVMHTWLTTQTEGWLRLGLDEYGIPYDYISVHDVRDDSRLGDKYDVIVFGPSVNDPLMVLNGMQGDEPIRWKKTDVTPNLGAVASTDDMRGGLGLTGLVNLQNFVRAGGTFIVLTNSSAVPVHFGFTQGVSIDEPEDLWAPGGVFRAEVSDRTSPLVYGYGEELGVYFDEGPVFAIAGDRARREEQASPVASTTARRSGRGGIGDSDIAQGRPRDLGQEKVEAFKLREGDEGGQQGGFFGFGGATTSNARTVMRFSTDVTRLLISGGLDNGESLAGAPALVDAPLGDGHVVMFAFNPYWRSQTLGSYALLFNAFLHHGSLSAGRAVADQ